MPFVTLQVQLSLRETVNRQGYREAGEDLAREVSKRDLVHQVVIQEEPEFIAKDGEVRGP